MRKADFDRKYKAIKGHTLNDIVVQGEDEHQIIDIYWSDILNKLVIVIK